MYSNPGQPFNQLAALSGSQCYGIIAVYYYLRCLTSEQKFEGAEGTESETADLAIDTLQVHEEGVDSKDCEFLILLSVVSQVEVDHLLHD